MEGYNLANMQKITKYMEVSDACCVESIIEYRPDGDTIQNNWIDFYQTVLFETQYYLNMMRL